MQPTPTAGPLKMVAHRFKNDHGDPVYLLGAIVCCGDAKAHGWPLVDEETLDKFAAHGANYTHIRLGPNSLTSPDADHTGYARVGNKLDLNAWDDSYWSRVRDCVEAARVRGIYTEVSLIDIWCFKHQAETCAWYGPANLQGYNIGSTAAVSQAPQTRHKKWVEKVVDELGAFDNVMWLDGNEVFDAHQDATAWTTGIHDIVRARETAKGFRHHVFGTNSQQPQLKWLSNTYEVYHEKTARASQGRPLITNEYGTITPDEYRKQAFSAVNKESSFMAWKGGQTSSQWEKTLDYMSQVRDHVGY
jgi:hypothetical protein